MDLHTSVMLALIRKAAKAFRKTSAANIPIPSTPADTGLPVEVIPFAGGVPLVCSDENVASRPWTVRALMNTNNRFAPLTDAPAQWQSVEQAQKALQAKFGSLLPAPEVAWQDPASDAALSRWAFEGLAAQHLEAAGASATSPREKDGFVVRQEAMAALPVRPGLASFGGDAWFTRDGQPCRIRLRGTDVHPGEPGWEAAKFAFRSSCLVWATLADHLGRCHLGMSSTTILATRRHLKPDHPLRSALAPFLFRTAAINSSASLSLTPPGGLVHRASGLTWEGMVSAFNTALSAWSPIRFDDELRSKGVHPDQLADPHMFPYGEEGLQYWQEVEIFVHGLGESLVDLKDPAVGRWWDEIRQRYPKLPPLHRKALHDYLCTLIFTVTAFHHHVGTVTPYVSDPRCLAGKLWKDQTMSDCQSTMQLATIACITGFELPALVDDWSHLMPDAGAKRAAGAFRAALARLQADVEGRNRQRPQPFRSFEPQQITTSVGI